MNRRPITSDSSGLQPRIGRLIGISMLALCLGSIAPSGALGDPMDEAPVNTGNSGKVGYRIVASVLIQLRNLARRQGNTELLELLNNTRISVPSKSLESQSPNAYAYIGNRNKNQIVVEQRWFGQVAGFAELAALFAIAESNWGFKEQFHEIYRDYCSRFQTAFRAQASGGNTPTYQFRISDYYSRSDSRNTGFYIGYDKVAGVTFMNTIVWTVLHEMGHHALEHTSELYPSLADRRADELAADRWAFDKMRELGFSLYPTAAYFLAREWSDGCFDDLGLLGKLADRTHPYWYDRTTPLVENYPWREAADQITRIYFLPVILTDGQPSYFVISLSDPSQNTPQAQIIQFGRPVPAIAEWNGDEVIVYVRDADRGRFEYRIGKPFQVLVSVEQRQYDASNRHIGTVSMEAIQQDVASMDFLTTGGISFADVRAMAESGDSWIRHLRNLGVADEKSLRARARRDRYTADKDRLDTRYMKGHLKLDPYIREFTLLSNRYKEDLINILGLQSYNRLYDNISAEVSSYAPFLLDLDDVNWEERVIRENLGQ